MRTIKFPEWHLKAALKDLGLLVTAMKTSAIFVSILALYYQDLSILFKDALQNEAASYILAIPFIFVYLLYRKRKMLRAIISGEAAQRPKPTTHLAVVCGVLTCATALILYWYGPYTFTPLEYRVISLCIFLVGLTLVMFNPKTLRVLAFPIVFLVFLTPPPLQILSEAGYILSIYASEAAYSLLRALTLPVTLQSSYGVPLLVLDGPGGTAFSFAIETACSGIYSLIGFGLFAVFVMYIARGASWKKATILIAGFSFIYALNIFRIIIIVSIGYVYGTEAALQTFHVFGGWALIFLGTLTLLFLSEKIWKIQILNKSTTAPCQNCAPVTESAQTFCPACGRFLNYTKPNVSKQDVFKPTALLLITILILSAQVPTFALTEGPAEIFLRSPAAEQSSTAKIFPEIPKYNLEFVYRDTNFEQTAPRDRALVYAYTPLNDSEKTVWVSLEIGSSRAVWHSWEASVITWPEKLGRPPLATQLDLRDIQLLQNPPLTARFFAFDSIDSSITQVVLYWYQNAIFNTGNSTSEEKYVKISLISYINGSANLQETEKGLIPFGLAIADYWEPIKTWSQIMLFLSRNGEILGGAVAWAMFGTIVLYCFSRRKERKTSYEVYQKLPRLNQQIIDTIMQTGKIATPTLNNIAKTYQNTTKEVVSERLLQHKILETEKTGIVRRDIVGRQDEPIQIWKTELSFPKAKTAAQKVRNEQTIS